MTNNNMIIIPHPPCSPDLSPCDFTLFPKLKMKGQHFEAVSDTQRQSQAVLDSIKENDFHGAFESWKKRWDCCIRSQGDYFERDSSKN
jgi:histone-lysine N-methyltransferase SETMAR